jgi:LysM repeat protein
VAGQILCIPNPAPNPCCNGDTQITVQQGQTVFDILLAYNISYRALQASNPDVNLSTLAAGQLLCVPSDGTRGTCVDCDTTYLIGPGETLETIARSTGTALEDLMRQNPTFLPGDFAEGMMICAS